MDKASQAMRRSGVRLKSIGSGHIDLQMVLAQLKEVRNTAKAFSSSQTSAIQDLVKWSLKDENIAIQDALSQVRDLFAIWTEVQMDLVYHMKEFKNQFEMILDGAKQIDTAKTDLHTAETKITKFKKESRRSSFTATSEENKEKSAKLRDAEREKEAANKEVVDKVINQESVKLKRIKEGLFNISDAYIEYGQKCDIIFKAQRDIALHIPDVNGKNIQDVKYAGIASTPSLVTLTKEKLKRFRRTDSCQNTHKEEENLPPPYSENPPFNPFYNVLTHTVHKRSISKASISIDEEVTKQTQALTPSSQFQPNLVNSSPPHSTNYSGMYPDLPVPCQPSLITETCHVDL